MRRLLTHLTQFAAFSKQGEVLCTQGLTYLLEQADARAAFTSFLAIEAGVELNDPLHWRAEIRQADGGRPDLEARNQSGAAVVKVEAKLSALLSEPQLQSYVKHLDRQMPTLLVVLVPRYRIGEATAMVSSAFAVEGEGPWSIAQGVSCAVTSWDRVLDALSPVPSEQFRDDLSQFRAMYRVLTGDDIQPLTSDEEVLAWRERETALMSVLDRATRRLTISGRTLPLATEVFSTSYYRRYVCRWIGKEQPCYSLGLRDPFEGHITPFWLRFNATTPLFPAIRDRLAASDLSTRTVHSEGHLWIPIDVPLNADGPAIIDSLTAQTEAVLKVVYESEIGRSLEPH